MRWSGIGLIAATFCTVSGCSQISGASSECSGADAKAVTLDLIRDQIMKLAGKQDEGDPRLSKAKIRATVRQLQLSLEDVRTTKDDPNSTKQFCTAKVKLVAPVDVVEDANSAREMAGMNSIEELADTANVEMDANAFKADMDFNVQPTDDGDKVYAQLESGDEAIEFFGELVKDHLLKNAVADAKAQSDRMVSEQEAAEANAEKAIAEASLDEAKATNKAAADAIGATWKALPPELRQQLLPMQRAWIKKTAASCLLEASQNASDDSSRNVAKLNCETREQNSRADYLRQVGQQSIEATDAEM